MGYRRLILIDHRDCPTAKRSANSADRDGRRPVPIRRHHGPAGGAGSVYVQGKDDLELPSGTELTLRATAPGR